MTSLKSYNTFGIDVYAERLICVNDERQIPQLIAEGTFKSAPFLILGGGSNMVFTKDYPGTVVVMQNKGIHLIGQTSDGGYLVEAAAGEVWDDFVHYCVAQHWYGTENLVAIPGTVGASPVQNVGAYGKEAKDIIYQVKAYDLTDGAIRIFENTECEFGYRSSIFKKQCKDRYLIASVTFRLTPYFVADIGYKAIAEALNTRHISQPTAQQIIDLITEIRWSKLPRPEIQGSAGSFFKNPMVSAQTYQELKCRYPDLVAYPTGENYKLAAGWLIEHAGWKGRALGRCGVYPKQALVLVNLGGCTGDEVVALSHAVMAAVFEQYGITLEPEAIFV